jgi:very-short-patch-repair endonuclease
MLRALSLWAGHGYALSHRTAAALHGFRRFPEGPIEVSVTRNLVAPPPVVVHRVNGLEARDYDGAQGFRVTSVTRTLLDLCAIVPEADLRATVDEALVRKRITLDRLAVALERVERPRGVAFLRRLLREYQGGDGPSESELEALVFERIARSGLPLPVRQRCVQIGGWRFRLDYLFPGFGVIIEADGFAHHASPISFEKDRERNNRLTARGFVVLHWTWRALHERPEELIKELACLLAQRAP